MDTVIVDRTGTLTEGRPTLTTVVPAAPIDEHTLLRLVASQEKVSEHSTNACRTRQDARVVPKVARADQGRVS